MMENTMHRKLINLEQIDLGMSQLRTALLDRLNEKGYGTFASRHEILGILTEEMNEYERAVEQEPANFDGLRRMRMELIDIAVAAVFGAVCLREETVDW